MQELFISAALSGASPAWKACLSPLPGEDACGAFLRDDAVYDAIREARREDDPLLAQGVWERERKKADWQETLRLCSMVLLERSKDLQVAAWASEAALMVYGIAALPAGLRLIAGLCAAFGDRLHPRPDAGEQEMRLACLSWLDDALARRIAGLPLTAPSLDAPDVYNYGHWRTMEHRERRGNGPSGDEPDRERLNRAAAHSPATFYVAWQGRLAESLSALKELRQAAEALCHGEAPSFHALESMLQAISERVTAWSPATAVLSAAPAEEPEKMFSDAPDIASRDQAYALLTAAADYLARTEPHSPTSWLVRRAVAWGHLSLAELFDEWLDGDENLSSLRKLLGMPPRA